MLDVLPLFLMHLSSAIMAATMPSIFSVDFSLTGFILPTGFRTFAFSKSSEPVRDRGLAYFQFAISFEDRFAA